MKIELTHREISFLYHRTRERQVQALKNGTNTRTDSAYTFRQELLNKLGRARQEVQLEWERGLGS